MHCTNCGNPLPENAKFCNVCAAPVAGAATAMTYAPATHPVPAPATMPAAIPPTAGMPAAVSPASLPLVMPASMGQRFANTFIDSVVVNLAVFGLSAAIGVFAHSGALEVVLIVLLCVVMFGYHLIMESVWQVTLGKLLTGTKVVDRLGNKPSFWKILGRTACRIIPFEWISFLFHGHPIGLHDQLSGTLVVPSRLTPAEVQSINPEELNKSSHSNPLVIILVIVGVVMVFIASIGIFSAVVLASLNTARVKGNDAAIKASMDTIRTQAALYYDENNQSYLGFCTSNEAQQALQSASSAHVSQMTTTPAPNCFDTDAAWAASAALSTGYFCVDSTGTGSITTTGLSQDEVSCPPGVDSTGTAASTGY